MGLENLPADTINKGIIAFVVKKIEANKKWKERSLFAFKRVQANPPSDEFERPTSISSNADDIIDNDLLLVEEDHCYAV